MREKQDLHWEAYSIIGGLGKRRRREMGIPLTRFAAEVRVPIATLTEFEHGLGPAPEDEMQRIEKGLGWERGAVTRTLANLHPDKTPSEWIFMETLDEEDSKTYG